MKQVAVLFARADSIYKTIPECDVYDIERDARTWTGGMPVVAHPPCRAWGRLRKFAKPRPDEKELAIFAVDQVRRFGGGTGASFRFFALGSCRIAGARPARCVRRLDAADFSKLVWPSR